MAQRLALEIPDSLSISSYLHLGTRDLASEPGSVHLPSIGIGFIVRRNRGGRSGVCITHKVSEYVYIKSWQKGAE